MSRLPVRSERKEMKQPSGHQRGWPVNLPRSEVSCLRRDPSRSPSHISGKPERADVNAMLLPSGEKSGSESSRVEAINLDGRRDPAEDSARFILQMLLSELDAT